MVIAPLDSIAPTLMPTVSPNPVSLGDEAVASANASDADSGIASQSCNAIDTSSVGEHSVRCTATDNAGNTATTETTYRVVYDFKGFYYPVRNLPTLNRVKAGRFVPFAFNLGGNYGKRVITRVVSTPINCFTLEPLERAGLTLQSNSFEDTGSVQLRESSVGASRRNPVYVYFWRTQRAWRGSCRQFTLTFNDTTEHQANFKFR